MKSARKAGSFAVEHRWAKVTLAVKELQVLRRTEHSPAQKNRTAQK
jgi:hypothetical protein